MTGVLPVIFISVRPALLGSASPQQTRPASTSSPIDIEGPKTAAGFPNVRYSFSNPWLVNFSVRLFSVTVRTT